MVAVITDRESLDDWLSNRSAAECAVIAARIALRAVAAVGPLERRAGLSGEIFALSAFRVAASLWVNAIRRAPSQWNQVDSSVDIDEGYVALRTARDSKRDMLANASAAAVEAILMASTADEDYHAIGLAAETTAKAARLATTTASTMELRDADPAAALYATASVFAAIQTDAEFLEVTSLDSVATRPLWHMNSPPAWAAKSWRTVSRSLLRSDGDWFVWTEWYESRLRGDPVDLRYEASRLHIYDSDWRAGPATVNLRLVSIDERFGRTPLTANDETSGSRLELVQRPATFRFIVQNGTLTAKPFDARLARLEAQRLYDQLKKSAEGLRDGVRRTDSPMAELLSQRAEDLLQVLGGSPAEVSAGDLLALWDSFDSFASLVSTPEGEIECSLPVRHLTEEVFRRLSALATLSPQIGEIIALRKSYSFTEEGEQQFDELQRQLVFAVGLPQLRSILDPSVESALKTHESRKRGILEAARRTDDIDAIARAKADATNIRKQQALDVANFAAGVKNGVDEESDALATVSGDWQKSWARFNQRLGNRMPEEAADALVDGVGSVLRTAPGIAFAALGAFISPVLGVLVGVAPLLFRANAKGLKAALPPVDAALGEEKT